MNQWVILCCSLVVLAGCGDDSCGERCTADLSCSAVVEVPSDSSLEQAAAAATPGTCISLAPGTYGDVTLSSGVRLLGPAASEVTVGSVTIGAGSATMLRGLHVAGVIKLLPDAVDVQLEKLLVTGSKNGVQAERGASFTLLASELVGVPENAVLAVDAARVTIRDSRIAAAGGPGMWVQCSDGCECATPPIVELERVKLEANHFVGIMLHGAAARLDDVEVVGTITGNNFVYGDGGGVVAAECSDLTAQGLTVDGNESFGVLVSRASAALGASGDDKGIVIVNNKVGGLWLQDIETSVVLENASLGGNAVVGIDIGGGSKGIVIVNNHVGNTAAEGTPALSYDIFGNLIEATNLQVIGDGVIWGDAAEVQIDGLTIGGSGRNALLIDGPVGSGSSLSNVTLDNGDEQLGIMQQRASGAGDAPTATNAPAVEQTVQAPNDVPAAPVAPAALATGS